MTAEQYYDNISIEFKYPFAQCFNDYYVHGDEDEPFFYHPDHLGGAAWITDMRGVPVQYLHYAPYGEFFANPANKNCTKEQVLQQRDKIENQVWQNAPNGETPIN